MNKRQQEILSKNLVMLKHINRAMKKGHTMFVIYNHHANCINMFDLRTPDVSSYRISFENNGSSYNDEYTGFSFNSFLNFSSFGYINEFVDSWKE